MTMPRRRLTALAILIALAIAAPPAASASNLSAAQQSYLTLAWNGTLQAYSLWWDRHAGWYRQTLDSHTHRPLATLWGSFPLFEALSGIALADPSPQTAKSLSDFAAGAERYWNPKLSPVGGYAPYPGGHTLHQGVFFDDNGWWGIAFLDAYRATGDARYLGDAKRAFDFVDAGGWDPAHGGLWWSTAHRHKAGESLAAGTLLAAMLYQETGDPYYFAQAQKLIGWGDQHFSSQGFYWRREDDQTAMAYVQGPMVAARAILCRASGDQVLCQQAESLADQAVHRFRSLDMGPQYDSIYLRSLLILYSIDGRAKWYDLVAQNAERALANARDAGGVYSRAWDGSPVTAHGIGANLLQTDAATISVFAWLAAIPAP